MLTLGELNSGKLSFESSLSLVQKFGDRALTEAQQTAVAQRMVETGECVLKAQASVTGGKDWSGENAKNLFRQDWISR